MPVLIASGASIANPSYTNDDLRQCFVMSDGRRLVIYGSGVLSYKTSADGITWSAATTITGTNGTGQHVAAIVQVGDTLYLWQIGVSGNLVKCVYSTGTNLLTASTPAIPTGVTYNLQHAGSLVVGYDTSNSCFYAAAVLSSVVTLFEVAGTLATYTGGSSGPMAFGPSAAAVDIAVIPGSPSTILVLYRSAVGLWVFPSTYTAPTFATGGPEQVIAGTIPGAACALDASNKLDVVWMDSAGNVVTRKRTATAVYNGQQSVGFSGDTSSPSITLTTDGSDLIAFYASAVSQSSGEVYLARRKAGTWTLGLLFAGGDASGYHTAKSTSATTTSRTDILYQKGGDVYYSFASTGSAPTTPVIASPSGFETSLAPTITAPYVNGSAPNDPQGAFEDQVLDGLTVMWDSGEVASSATSNVYGTNSNTGDPNYVAPSVLVYGTAYTVSRRYKDSLLVPAQWSDWSTPVSFTPVQGGTATITSLSDGGTVEGSSPVSLGSPAFDYIVGSWAHPLAHGADQYQDVIYAADDVTVVALGVATTIGGGLADGASFTSGPWSPAGLANSTTYKLARRYRDETTLLWSESAHWELDTSWTPPPAPSGLSVLWVEHPGYSFVSWTNPGAAVSVILERSLAGAADWVTIFKGSLIDQAADMTPLEIEVGWDWRVSALDDRGIQSDHAAVSSLATPDGIFGMVLVDATNPAVWCHFGPVQDWKQASTWDEPSDIQQTMPLGALRPKVSRRYLDYGEAKQREFVVPPDGPYFSGGAEYFQAAAIATFRAMGKSGNDIWYRDINEPEGRYVQISNVQRSIGQDGTPMWRVQWDMVEVNGPGGDGNPGMPFVLAGVTGPPLSPDGSIAGNFIPGTSWPGG